MIWLRLDGHRAAAVHLWFIEDGSNAGFLEYQAGLAFQALPTEVQQAFIYRAISLMASHPMVSCDHLL